MALKTGIVGLPNVGKVRGCCAACHYAAQHSFALFPILAAC
jgi:ribosome-binding ATPase YchF (GTP1/OBG family)